MERKCHEIAGENWYVLQTGPRTVGVFDRPTDTLIETVAPPTEWKDWVFHLDDKGIVFINLPKGC